jgi:hypothetical protein
MNSLKDFGFFPLLFSGVLDRERRSSDRLRSFRRGKRLRGVLLLLERLTGRRFFRGGEATFSCFLFGGPFSLSELSELSELELGLRSRLRLTGLLALIARPNASRLSSVSSLFAFMKIF